MPPKKEEEVEEEDEEDDEELEEDGIDDDVILIVDNGSGTCKAGLSCDNHPQHVFPELVGLPRKENGEEDPPRFYGQDALDRACELHLKYPLENGIIENFAQMEELWEWTLFDCLKANPERHPILLTEPPFNPKPNREKMVEIMFEQFGVPSLNISIQGVLALLGVGRTTGVVLDCGEGVSSTIPIYDGYGMPHCINRMDTAGREIHVLLGKLLAQNRNCLTTSTAQYQLRLMKEKYCYVAQDVSAPDSERVEHKLPDGRSILMKDERWMAPEALFAPRMAGLDVESKGVAGMVWDTITRCDMDTRKTLLNNIVLSGGSTMFKGFNTRLAKELRAVVPSAAMNAIRVIPSKDGALATWSGAQVFASLKDIQINQWISIEDFEERGVGYIHEKMAVKYK